MKDEIETGQQAAETPPPTVNENTETKTADILPQSLIDIGLQKRALNYNLVKWILGTFLLTIITFTVNFYFRDKAEGIKELDAYGKYTTDIMVLNENPVKKRMLAQFFAKAAPSFWVRWAWEDYYTEVQIDYDTYKNEQKSMFKEYESLLIKRDNSGVKLNSYETNRLNRLCKVLIDNYEEEKQPINTPENNELKLTANDFEKRGFEALKNKKLDEAKLNFNKSYEIFPSLHNVDEISKLLNSKLIKDDKSWNEIYNIILKKYSWGMSSDIKNEFNQLISKTNN